MKVIVKAKLLYGPASYTRLHKNKLYTFSSIAHCASYICVSAKRLKAVLDKYGFRYENSPSDWELIEARDEVMWAIKFIHGEEPILRLTPMAVTDTAVAWLNAIGIPSPEVKEFYTHKDAMKFLGLKSSTYFRRLHKLPVGVEVANAFVLHDVVSYSAYRGRELDATKATPLLQKKGGNLDE